MGTEIIEIGKISSRGQIAIPSEIRQKLDLQEGSKVFFLVDNDLLLLKKVTSETFAQITKPLRKARKKIKFYSFSVCMFARLYLNADLCKQHFCYSQCAKDNILCIAKEGNLVRVSCDSYVEDCSGYFLWAFPRCFQEFCS